MHELLQRLSQHHRMIVVLPEGAKDGWYIDSPTLPRHLYARHLLDEVLPDAERWLPCNARRSIAGISAGGNGAIVSALRRPGLFRGMSALSGALDLTLARQRPALTRALGAYERDPDLWQRWSARRVLTRDPTLARRLPLLLTVGSGDIWAKVNRQVSAELQAHCVPHLFYEEPGGHTWTHWAAVLPRHLEFHARLLVSVRP
jgi:S-formylglutathione hydrolase FrmB